LLSPSWRLSVIVSWHYVCLLDSLFSYFTQKQVLRSFNVKGPRRHFGKARNACDYFCWKLGGYDHPPQ
jgi:hypothetical protein